MDFSLVQNHTGTHFVQTKLLHPAHTGQWGLLLCPAGPEQLEPLLLMVPHWLFLIILIILDSESAAPAPQVDQSWLLL